jgi:hypothetical protein
MGTLRLKQGVNPLAKPRDVATAQLIKPKHDKASSCPKPKCGACCLSKTGRSSDQITIVVNTSDRNLIDGALSPGNVVHLEQYMPVLPGCLPHTFGKENPKSRLTDGTILVDEKMGFIHHHHQVSLSDGEILKGNNTFEKGAAQLGVKIRTFKSDNAHFSPVEFRNDIANKGQDITFSGVGAHRQNGVAECAVKTITSSARTMMLHAILQWHEQTPCGNSPWTTRIIL